MSQAEEIRKEARRLLEEGEVKYVVGYRRGPDGLTAAPFFAATPEDAELLIWDPTCVHNLVRFVRDEKRRKGRAKDPDHRPVAIVVKGCDSRAVNVLLQEKFIERDEVYLIGVSCEDSGVADSKKLAHRFKGRKVDGIERDGEDAFSVASEGKKITVPAAELLADRCLECQASYPVVSDFLTGTKTERKPEKPYGSVEKMEEMPSAERRAFWEEQIGRCIRCYACRSVCPMCFCDECVVDTINFAVNPGTSAEEKADRIKWIERGSDSSENFGYHFVRAIHLAGRCIDCGECQRVCPLDIPVRFLNKKLEKAAKELFDYDAGFDAEGDSLVASFRDDDPGEFIR
jgi:formate dehydrogenase subunit beta